MRIAIFSDNFYPELSGVADSVMTLAEELASLGHDVCICAPRYTKKDYAVAGLSMEEPFLGDRVRIIRFSSFHFSGPTLQARMVIPYFFRWLFLRSFRPDVIHTQMFFGTGLEALAAAKCLRVPLIGTNHTAISEFVRYAPIKGAWLTRFSLRAVSWYYNQCAVVSAPSRSVFDEMLENGFTRPYQVISNPFDLEFFHPVPEEKKQELKRSFSFSEATLIYAGRFAQEKNIDVILRALPIVKKTIPHIMLVLAGHGSERPALEALVQELGISENVKFLGTLDKSRLADAYRAADVFVTTSTSETQSMVLLQAFASGLPAIGVNARALPEYINRENGFIVEPGDSAALAERIIYLFQRPAERQALGQGAVDFMQRFSVTRIAKEWETTYASALAHKNPSRECPMKISFVIPAYNEEAGIGRCLTALMKEARRKPYTVEVIVVNNASTDKTKEIVLADFPDVLVVDEPKKGLVNARQAGYLAATGEIIANVDADTKLPEGWLDTVVEAFTENPKLAALSGPYIYYDLSRITNFFVRAYYFLGYLGGLFSYYVLRRGWTMLQGGNFVLRKSALDAVDGFDTDFDFYGEDTAIARRIGKAGDVVFTFQLPMYTSGRRLAEEGLFRMAYKYGMNHLWTIFFHKPYTKTYQDIRR